MTLTNRLNWFSLATLALVLAGFSFTIYLLASRHLNAKARDLVESALNTLAAASEIKSNGVEWEPSERRLIVTRTGAEERLAWQVNAEDGRIIGGSLSPSSVEANDLTFRVANSYQAGRFPPQ